MDQRRKKGQEVGGLLCIKLKTRRPASFEEKKRGEGNVERKRTVRFKGSQKKRVVLRGRG